MDAKARIRAYHDALEAGDPLGPFFAGGGVVKFGISERLVGGEEVRRGLREQTERTAGWSVDSRDLRVTTRACHAWFSDDATLSWEDVAEGTRHTFETRGGGTLEAREGTEPVFVGMHVSTSRSF